MFSAGRRLGKLAPQILLTLCRTPETAVCTEIGAGARLLLTDARAPHLSQRLQLLQSLQGWQPGSCRGMASYPPHTVLDMPALSPTMSQGNIAAWKKKEGEEIAAGDVLCEIETDKATMEWEAQDEGFLAKILMSDGSKEVPVGTPVAVVVEDGENAGAFEGYSPDEAGAAAAPSAAKEEAPPPEAEGRGEEEGEPEAEAEEGAASGGGGGDFPPHRVEGLPALSPTMSQGNIAKWNKKEGEEISAGDSIAEIETDKATMDWEAQDDGFVAKLLAAEGAKDVAVGQPVIVIVEDQGDIEAFKSFTAEDAAGGKPKPKPKSKPEAEPPKKQRQAPAEPSGREEAAKPAPARASGERVKASPYARKLAREAGVEISQAAATGPEGRIVAADVQKLISSGGGGGKAEEAPAKAGQAAEAKQGAVGQTAYKDVPVSQIKKITAGRLLESKQTIPHYYLTSECRVDKLLALRQQLNEALAAGSAGGKLSLNDFVIKASALALKKVPQVNASWRGEVIREFADINVGVAVQTDGGLLVPVLPNADSRGLGDISRSVKDLAGKARENKLKPTDFDNGTFTISNLGMFGIQQFAAIINPPQAAILAVGGTTKRVITDPSGGFSEASVMMVTLSCDHRVVDGALGAVWLQAFRANIEDPVTMLL